MHQLGISEMVTCLQLGIRPKHKTRLFLHKIANHIFFFQRQTDMVGCKISVFYRQEPEW